MLGKYPILLDTLPPKIPLISKNYSQNFSKKKKKLDLEFFSKTIPKTQNPTFFRIKVEKLCISESKVNRNLLRKAPDKIMDAF